MDAIFQRLFDVAGCRSQVELADFLGVRRAAISDAKRRGIIPADWLHFLQKTKGIRPEWILSGTPPQYEDTGE